MTTPVAGGSSSESQHGDDHPVRHLLRTFQRRFDSTNMSNPESTKQSIAVLAVDGFDSLQVSGIVAAISTAGHKAVIIGSRQGSAYPRGVTEGDDKTTGVIAGASTLANAGSFSALFIPDGDDKFVATLESDEVLTKIRQVAKEYQTIGAVGAAVPVLAHKAFPGDTDLKADLAAAYSSKKGFVLAQNLVSDEASAWAKIKGVADLGGFGFAFFDAISKQPHKDRDVSAIKN
ncbi:uncharacterized protein JCM15063_000877 [Sporobolomyces koalae]|uniref:uncharacterized protein n=1 Tax=Sporobolomyces koalae TaxID=500713 RepID=UPI00316E191A